MRHAASLLAALVAGLILLAPAAEAKPAVCGADVIQNILIGAGRLAQDDVDNGMKVDRVRCGDVTADGAADAVFTIASGGTAGDIRFGVIEGGGVDGGGEVALFKQAYQVGVARHNNRSFDVLQPRFGRNDPNCCPSSFRQTRYTWTGTGFKAGKAKKLRKAPARFYHP
jgi:hypothetical protein